MSYTALFRIPRTQREARSYFVTTWNELDIPVRVRGRGLPKYLPSYWDDESQSNGYWLSVREVVFSLVSHLAHGFGSGSQFFEEIVPCER